MKPIIRHQLASSTGANERTEVELEADTSNGEVHLVVRKTIIEYFPVTDYEKVMDLHERLNRGGGRRRYTLEDLTK